MSILDMVARAEQSSDLQHHDHDCAVDVLGAVGMAAAHNVRHLAIYRVKYLNDAAEIEPAKRLFIQWARIAMLRRGMNPASASRVGTQALTAWLDDVCHACNGLRYVTFEGSPALTDRQCPKCDGTGRNKIRQSGELLEVVKDLHERADSAVLTIQRGVRDRLGRE